MQLQDDLEIMAPEVSTDSEMYQQVPIADFGDAMLRGMGWTGKIAKGDADDLNSTPLPNSTTTKETRQRQRRVIIRKCDGVPGLSMILVHVRDVHPLKA